MGGKSEGELAKELNQLFDAYDLDESGQLDPQEFAMCLESLDLGIDRGQIDALLVVADADNSGLVDRKEFMAFTFKHLVHLMKERHLSKLHADIDHAAKHEALDGASDDDDDKPGRVDAHAFDGLLSPQLTAELAGEQINLMEMFRRADVNQEGFLGTTEFHRMLEAMDLGLTQYQMARLMAEADENEDGVISYAEFVPVMLRFLQTYQTKQQANIDWEEREAKAKNLAFDPQQEAGPAAQAAPHHDHQGRPQHRHRLRGRRRGDLRGDDEAPVARARRPRRGFGIRPARRVEDPRPARRRGQGDAPHPLGRGCHVFKRADCPRPRARAAPRRTCGR